MESKHDSGSVTRWIRELKTGNTNSFAKLWDRYFLKIKLNARKHFANTPRIVRDEEDIALSVLGVLAKSSSLADVTDREGLLRLLAVITKNKVASEKRTQRTLSRGSGKVSVLSDLKGMLKESATATRSSMPSPAAIVQLAEQYQMLLDFLPDDEFRKIVKLKLSGKTILEIADELGVIRATITRKLRIIQKIWRATLGDQDAEPESQAK
jgi:DNA-directed RNA polymerase specialized sigma24 family protein